MSKRGTLSFVHLIIWHCRVELVHRGDDAFADEGLDGVNGTVEGEVHEAGLFAREVLQHMGSASFAAGGAPDAQAQARKFLTANALNDGLDAIVPG